MNEKLLNRAVLNLDQTAEWGFADNFDLDDIPLIGSVIYDTEDSGNVFIGILANGEYSTVVMRESITSKSLPEVESWLAARLHLCG